MSHHDSSRDLSFQSFRVTQSKADASSALIINKGLVLKWRYAGLHTDSCCYWKPHALINKPVRLCMGAYHCLRRKTKLFLSLPLNIHALLCFELGFWLLLKSSKRNSKAVWVYVVFCCYILLYARLRLWDLCLSHWLSPFRKAFSLSGTIQRECIGYNTTQTRKF